VATLVASVEAPPEEAPRKPNLMRKTLFALFGVMVGVGLLALCLISAARHFSHRAALADHRQDSLIPLLSHA